MAEFNMDTTNSALLSTTTATTIFGVIVVVYKAINGKKIRSRCCDRDVEMGMAVEDMTPPHQKSKDTFEVQNPVQNQRSTQIVIPTP
jgi:hypothetical protein